MGLFSIVLTLAFIILGLFRRDSKFITGGLLVLIYVLFAFEHSDGDYEGYLDMFAEITSGLDLIYEPLYVWSCMLAGNYGLDFDNMRMIISLFEVAILYYVTWRYTKNTAMVLALFFIFPATLDAELFRFLFGMMMSILGVSFLIAYRSKKNIALYLLCVSIGALYHTSCWLYLIYLLLLIEDCKKLRKIVTISLVVSIALVGTGLFFNLLQLLPIRDTVIDKYETGSYSNMAGLIFACIKQVIILFMAIIATKKMPTSNYNNIPKIDRKNHAMILQNKITNLNVVSFLLLIALYYSSSSQRLVHLVIYFNFIALANSCSLGYNKRQCWLYAISSAILFLLFLLFIEGTGTVYASTSPFTEGYFIKLFK